jgi:acetyltransferase-like isoleucine patch superfamily enzyme
LLSRRALAISTHPAARAARRIRAALRAASLPAPRVVVRPALAVVLAVRNLYYFAARVFVCEPLFKAYCLEYGRNLHTGVFLHWVQGRGDIVLGDDVTFDGKSSITFAARYTERPMLRVGDRTGINHNVTLVIGREITVGCDCRIASNVAIFDVNGHPADPEARRAGMPPSSEEVKPVRIGDNVWVGRNAIIHPGVTIGDGSIVSAGSVVVSDVPPLSVVAGNPARKIGALGAAAASASKTP